MKRESASITNNMPPQASDPAGDSSGSEPDSADSSASGGLFWQEEVEKKDAELANLTEKLTEQNDSQKEERFIFILLVVILLDVVIFAASDSFTAPIVLGAFQLLLFIPLARRMGLDEIVGLLDRVINRAVAFLPDKDKDK